MTANWRKPRWIIGISLATLLVIGIVVFAIAWSQRGAEEASVKEVLEEQEEDGARDGARAFLQPATGVYVYEGTGTEHLSVLSTSQEWGPRLPAVIRRSENDCWTFKIEYSTNHWQQTTYCPHARTLQESGGQTFQSFDFVVAPIKDHNVFVCDPPGITLRVDATPGMTWDQVCKGRSKSRQTEVTSSGTNLFIGIETVAIGDEQVRAYHYEYRRTLSGSQTGEDRSEIWFRIDDGLPVRAIREVRAESPSPIGAVTYTENGTYILTSLEPKR